MNVCRYILCVVECVYECVCVLLSVCVFVCVCMEEGEEEEGRLHSVLIPAFNCFWSSSDSQ